MAIAYPLDEAAATALRNLTLKHGFRNVAAEMHRAAVRQLVNLPTDTQRPFVAQLDDALTRRLQQDLGEPRSAPADARRLRAKVLTDSELVERMSQALSAARDKFQAYAVLHHAKGTDEARAKAEANEAMSDLCDAALQAAVDTGRYVWED